MNRRKPVNHFPQENSIEELSSIPEAGLPQADTEHAELIEQLRAAWSPSAPSEATHLRLLSLALEDPFAPASEAELELAAELNRELVNLSEETQSIPFEGGSQLSSEEPSTAPFSSVFLGVGSPNAALLASVKAPFSNGEISPALNTSLIQAALAHHSAQQPESEAAAQSALLTPPEKSSGDLASQSVVGELIPLRQKRRLNFGFIGSMVAAAALGLIWLSNSQLAERRAEPASLQRVAAEELSVSRSTSELFNAKFSTETTSERLDTIAEQRARELRKNRYASWGAR